MPTKVADIMSRLPSAFIPEKAQGLDAVLQFTFTGAESGEWNVVIKDGKVNVQHGVHPHPKVTLAADSSDFIKVFTGQLDPMQAYMAGKLKLSGDLNLAMKMTQFFRMH